MQSLFKRLNKNWAFTLVLGAIAFLIFFGCKKKDRLSSSTFKFSVSPPASTILKTESITLTAQGVSSTGPVEVNPTWEVSSDLLGNLSSPIGPTVVFQPSALGDVVVTATFDGISAASRLAIVTYKPTSNTFDVYNDAGLPSEAGTNSDIFDPGSLLTELSSGYTTEGIKYMRATGATSGGFWGVTLDKASVGLSKNLSSFASGSLKFSLRLTRALSVGEVIRIDVSDTSSTKQFTLVSQQDGYVRTSTEWQEISLPLSSRFSGLDLAHVKVPFAIVTSTLFQPLTFDCDAVRWEK